MSYKRDLWDRAVRSIEGYRLRHGVTDKDAALGAQLRPPLDRRQNRVAGRVEQTQRRLGIERGRGMERSRDLGRGIERTLRRSYPGR